MFLFSYLDLFSLVVLSVTIEICPYAIGIRCIGIDFYGAITGHYFHNYTFSIDRGRDESCRSFPVGFNGLFFYHQFLICVPIDECGEDLCRGIPTRSEEGGKECKKRE
ncbi:hypothetical protein [Porphyromonas gingivalis]|uniref:hypothetical protein n=1 Tax=Porphyromonas gingivalis TaxID=837 RepID=UPI000BE70CD2|nr:hypothetical protein [Porphyromonas gingivalis]PDP47471.1 hypothetical protein CLI82_02365 [Porphyromonas gingivalis]QUI89312.1 hypothetical protein KDH82_08740 [Porphyromonas gingivalis]QUI91257.1 hypothetical protein KC155_08735 [Porphyromonas gingivalis]